MDEELRKELHSIYVKVNTTLVLVVLIFIMMILAQK